MWIQKLAQRHPTFLVTGHWTTACHVCVTEPNPNMNFAYITTSYSLHIVIVIVIVMLYLYKLYKRYIYIIYIRYYIRTFHTLFIDQSTYNSLCDKDFRHPGISWCMPFVHDLGWFLTSVAKVTKLFTSRGRSNFEISKFDLSSTSLAELGRPAVLP